CGTLLAALRNSDHRQKPFDYWLLEDILPDAVRDAIAELPFSPPDDTIFDGRSETNNTKRIYFTPLNQRRFAVCREVADAFRSYQIVRSIERTTALYHACISYRRPRSTRCRHRHLRHRPRAQAGRERSVRAQRRIDLYSRQEHVARLAQTPDPWRAQVNYHQLRRT